MEDYSMLETIGEGTFGIVYKANNKKTGQLVAIKIMSIISAEGFPKEALKEISLLKEVIHPNIISLEDVVMGEQRLYLIFEFLEMDLWQYQNKIEADMYMDSKLVKSYLYQTNEAILFCHQRRIVHRDLKPENLLISMDGRIKVADFGLGRAFGIPVKAYSQDVITLNYRPPELLLGCKKYSSAVDIWSLGCIFAEMATKQTLFLGTSEISQILEIFRILSTPTDDIWPGVSSLKHYPVTTPKCTSFNLVSQIKNLDDDGIDLLQKMLVYNPDKRILAKQIAVHPFFEDLDLTVKPVFTEKHKI